MRNETRIALSVIGLSAITTSYLLGHQSSEAGLALSANAASEQATETQPVEVQATTEPAVSESSAATTAVPETTAKSTATPTSDPQPSTTNAAEPMPAATEEPLPSPGAGVSGTFQSESVFYKYGQVQVEIVLADGVLTNVNLLQATTKGRGYEQAPPLLVEAALSAGGSNFGNLSGATFTTEAFKSALDQAFAKAGL